MWRRAIASVAVALFAVGLPTGATGAAPPEDPAERAAREIEEAQQRANDAAEAYFDAESELDGLEVEAQRLADRREQLVVKVGRLERRADEVAVDQFTSVGSRGIPLLTGPREGNERAQAAFYSSIALNRSSEDLDAHEVAQGELDDLDAEIERQGAELDDVKGEQTALREAAEEEVERLGDVEEQRLKDEAVRIELERRRAERQRQLEEEARVAAERQAAERAEQL
ncbi:MAG: hypothetical protein M3Q72_14440, partial [Actinomycetota bacterium]|nr:hypothetical protein [Actinomycetota bacterium]